MIKEVVNLRHLKKFIMIKKILLICNSSFAYNKFIKETEKFYLKNNYLVDVVIGSNSISKKKK